MKIFETRKQLTVYLDHCRRSHKSTGFVPTMGALHPGHLMLVKRAKKENDLSVCSIFVNPTQFNNKKDLDKYPRTLSEDIKKLKSVKCDVLFAPSEKEMYPAGDLTNDLEIDFGEMDRVMEGRYRPGHFKGVAIVVNKLFSMVRPDKAYFGEKDYQQLQIVKKMTELLKHPVKIIPCPTLREADGLAMSSRNSRLTPEERVEAPFIYKILKSIKTLRKNYSVAGVKKSILKHFLENKKLKLEYFEIADAVSLKPLKRWHPAGRSVACIAAYLGNVRLIDNIKL